MQACVSVACRCPGNTSQICGGNNALDVYQRVVTEQLPCLQLPGETVPSWGGPRLLRCEPVAAPEGIRGEGGGANVSPGTGTVTGEQPSMGSGQAPEADATPPAKPVTQMPAGSKPSPAFPVVAVASACGGAGAAILLAAAAWYLLTAGKWQARQDLLQGSALQAKAEEGRISPGSSLLASTTGRSGESGAAMLDKACPTSLLPIETSPILSVTTDTGTGKSTGGQLFMPCPALPLRPSC